MDKRAECLEIYREAFGDDYGDFEKQLFNSCFNYCKTVQSNGKTVSMLFLLPCEIEFSDKKETAYYIYAVATDKEYRRKGYMRKLLESVKNETDGTVFLRPADEDLITLYEKCGFKVADAVSLENGYPTVIPKDNFSELAKADDSVPNGEKFKIMYFSKSGIEINNLHFVYSME